VTLPNVNLAIAQKDGHIEHFGRPSQVLNMPLAGAAWTSITAKGGGSRLGLFGERDADDRSLDGHKVGKKRVQAGGVACIVEVRAGVDEVANDELVFLVGEDGQPILCIAPGIRRDRDRSLNAGSSLMTVAMVAFRGAFSNIGVKSDATRPYRIDE
jgi:hypothetical protein